MTTIRADFNMLDEEGRVWLPAAERERVSRGERVVLTDGEVEVAAVLEYDAGRHVWIGSPDRDTLRLVTATSGTPAPTF